jgi:Fe2+ transport system protein B
VKKAARLLIIVLVVVWVVQNPAAAAQFAHHAESWFGQAGQALTTLTRNL